MVQMNIAEAKAKLSELVARAEAGEEVLIARDGVPAVILKPAGRKRVHLGVLAHLGGAALTPDVVARAFAEDDLEAWKALASLDGFGAAVSSATASGVRED